MCKILGVKNKSHFTGNEMGSQPTQARPLRFRGIKKKWFFLLTSCSSRWRASLGKLLGRLGRVALTGFRISGAELFRSKWTRWFSALDWLTIRGSWLSKSSDLDLAKMLGEFRPEPGFPGLFTFCSMRRNRALVVTNSASFLVTWNTFEGWKKTSLFMV